MHTLIGKKASCDHFFRAIGYEHDKDILDIFGLADEVKAKKSTLNKIVGKKLAARVLRTWVEDFSDEDTGELVHIERNEVVIDRDIVIEKKSHSANYRFRC